MSVRQERSARRQRNNNNKRRYHQQPSFKKNSKLLCNVSATIKQVQSHVFDKPAAAQQQAETIWLSPQLCARIVMGRLRRLVLEPEWQLLVANQDPLRVLHVNNTKFEKTIEIMDRLTEAVVFVRTAYPTTLAPAPGATTAETIKDVVANGFLDAAGAVSYSYWSTKEHSISTLTLPFLKQGARMTIRERRIRPAVERDFHRLHDTQGLGTKVDHDSHTVYLAGAVDSSSDSDSDDDDVEDDEGDYDDGEADEQQGNRQMDPARNARILAAAKRTAERLERRSERLKQSRIIDHMSTEVRKRAATGRCSRNEQRALACSEYTLEIPWALFPPCCQARGLSCARELAYRQAASRVDDGKAEIVSVTLPEYRLVHSATIDFTTNMDGTCDAQSRTCSISWLNSFTPCDDICRSVFVAKEADRVMPEHDWLCEHLERTKEGLVIRERSESESSTPVMGAIKVPMDDILQEYQRGNRVKAMLNEHHATLPVAETKAGEGDVFLKMEPSPDSIATFAALKLTDFKQETFIETCATCCDNDPAQWKNKEDQYMLDAHARARERTRDFELLISRRHDECRQLYREHHAAFAELVRRHSQVHQTKRMDERKGKDSSPLLGYLPCVLPHDLSSCRFFRWSSAMTGPDLFARVICLEDDAFLVDHSVVRHPRTTLSTLLTADMTDHSNMSMLRRRREEDDAGGRCTEESLKYATMAGAIAYFGTFFDVGSDASSHRLRHQWWGLADSCRIKVWDNETGVLVDHIAESSCDSFGERMDAIALSDDPWSLWKTDEDSSRARHIFADVPTMSYERLCRTRRAKSHKVGGHASMKDFAMGPAFAWENSTEGNIVVASPARATELAIAACATLSEELLTQALSDAANQEETLHATSAGDHDKIVTQFCQLPSYKARCALTARFGLTENGCLTRGCNCRQSAQECRAQFMSGRDSQGDAVRLPQQHGTRCKGCSHPIFDHGYLEEVQDTDNVRENDKTKTEVSRESGQDPVGQNAGNGHVPVVHPDRQLGAEDDQGEELKMQSAKVNVLISNQYMLLCSLRVDLYNALRRLSRARIEQRLVTDARKTCMKELADLVPLASVKGQGTTAVLQQVEDGRLQEAVCPRILSVVKARATEEFRGKQRATDEVYRRRFTQLQLVLQALLPFSRCAELPSSAHEHQQDILGQWLDIALDIVANVEHVMFAVSYETTTPAATVTRMDRAGDRSGGSVHAATSRATADSYPCECDSTSRQRQVPVTCNPGITHRIGEFCTNWHLLHPETCWEGSEAFHNREKLVWSWWRRLDSSEVHRTQEYQRWRWITDPCSGDLIYRASCGSDRISPHEWLCLFPTTFRVLYESKGGKDRYKAVVDLFWQRYGAVVPFASDRETSLNTLFLFNAPIGQDMGSPQDITFQVPTAYVLDLVDRPLCAARDVGWQWTDFYDMQEMLEAIRCSLERNDGRFCQPDLVNDYDLRSSKWEATRTCPTWEQRRRASSLLVDRLRFICGTQASHKDVASLLLAVPPCLLDAILDRFEQWSCFSGNPRDHERCNFNSWSVVTYHVGDLTKTTNGSIWGWWDRSPCLVAESVSFDRCRIQAYSPVQRRLPRNAREMISAWMRDRQESTKTAGMMSSANVDKIVRFYVVQGEDRKWIDCGVNHIMVYSAPTDSCSNSWGKFMPLTGIEWCNKTQTMRFCKWSVSSQEDKAKATTGDIRHVTDASRRPHWAVLENRPLFSHPLGSAVWRAHWTVLENQPLFSKSAADEYWADVKTYAANNARFRSSADHIHPVHDDSSAPHILTIYPFDRVGSQLVAWNADTDAVRPTHEPHLRWCCYNLIARMVHVVEKTGAALQNDPAILSSTFKERCDRASFVCLYSGLVEIAVEFERRFELPVEQQTPSDVKDLPLCKEQIDRIRAWIIKIRKARVFDQPRWRVTATSPGDDAEDFGSVLDFWKWDHDIVGDDTMKSGAWSFLEEGLDRMGTYQKSVDRARAKRLAALKGEVKSVDDSLFPEESKDTDSKIARLGGQSVFGDERDSDRPFDPALAESIVRWDVDWRKAARKSPAPHDWTQFPGVMYVLFDSIHSLFRGMSRIEYAGNAGLDRSIVPQDQLLRLHSAALQQLVGFQNDKWLPLDGVVREVLVESALFHQEHLRKTQCRNVSRLVGVCLHHVAATRTAVVELQEEVGHEFYQLPWSSYKTTTEVESFDDGSGRVASDENADEYEYMMEVEHRVTSPRLELRDFRIANDNRNHAGDDDGDGDRKTRRSVPPFTQLPGGYVDQFRKWWKRRKEKKQEKRAAKEADKTLAASKLHSKVDKTAKEAAIITARAEENKVELKTKIGQRKQTYEERGFKFTWSADHDEMVVTEIRVPDGARIAGLATFGGSSASGGGNGRFPGKLHASACETVAHHLFYHQDFAVSPFVHRELRLRNMSASALPASQHFFFLDKLQGRTCALCLKDTQAHTMRVLMPCQHKYCAHCLNESDRRWGAHMCPECGKNDHQYRYQEAVQAPFLFDEGAIPEIRSTHSLISSVGESVTYRIGQTQTLEDIGQQWNAKSESRECATGSPGFYYHRVLRQLAVWRDFSPGSIQAAWREQLQQLSQVRVEFPRLFHGVSEAARQAVANELFFPSYKQKQQQDQQVESKGDFKIHVSSAAGAVGLGLGGQAKAMDEFDKGDGKRARREEDLVVFHGDFGTYGSGPDLYASPVAVTTAAVPAAASALSALGARSDATTLLYSATTAFCEVEHLEKYCTVDEKADGKVSGTFIPQRSEQDATNDAQLIQFHSDTLSTAAPGGPAVDDEWLDFQSACVELPGVVPDSEGESAADASAIDTLEEQQRLLSLFALLPPSVKAAGASASSSAADAVTPSQMVSSKTLQGVVVSIATDPAPSNASVGSAENEPYELVLE